MKHISLIYGMALAFFLFSCNSDDSSDISLTDESAAFDSSTGGSSSSGGSQQGGEAGLITAGEWNDLDNWDFWEEIISGEDYSDKDDYWQFYHNNRVAVEVKKGNQPVVDAKVVLKNGAGTAWRARTDNLGKAELWISLFDENTNINISDYSLSVNDQAIETNLQWFEQGINKIQLTNAPEMNNRVELSFIVDATGSMADELEFLKDDLEDVIRRVESSNASLDIITSSVFYRDEGDDYVVKSSPFSNDLSTTLTFINAQRADGGGDFPEAVHSALIEGIDELSWSDEARTRLAFLLLDAPPHYDPKVLSDLHVIIERAAEKGIKVIPISASGIDKETEFLMRFFAITTNGTYVFITNHSGIGNEHIEASVGEYEVEYLNDLMVRLIQKYSE
jgi:hypothetical protein